MMASLSHETLQSQQPLFIGHDRSLQAVCYACCLDGSTNCIRHAKLRVASRNREIIDDRRKRDSRVTKYRRRRCSTSELVIFPPRRLRQASRTTGLLPCTSSWTPPGNSNEEVRLSPSTGSNTQRDTIQQPVAASCVKVDWLVSMVC